MRAAVAAGPVFVVGGDAPVFIDEYQRVPELLDTIKAELNRDVRPGRFVLTGSTSYTTLPRAAQSLTGRAQRLDASVAGDYAQLLEALFLVHRLPAWGTTLGSRVNVHPKVHVVDSCIGGWLLDLTVDAVARRLPSVLTDLGHLIETFAVNELLKQIAWRPDVGPATTGRTTGTRWISSSRRRAAMSRSSRGSG